MGYYSSSQLRSIHASYTVTKKSHVLTEDNSELMKVERVDLSGKKKRPRIPYKEKIASSTSPVVAAVHRANLQRNHEEFVKTPMYREVIMAIPTKVAEKQLEVGMVIEYPVFGTLERVLITTSNIEYFKTLKKWECVSRKAFFKTF